jgi:monoterpene epsilon-lactone hydrolase
VSLVYASLAGLPPLLIQTGSHEILLDDAIRLTRAGAFLRQHIAAADARVIPK